jgi:iron complex transport system substrate-binding protein
MQKLLWWVFPAALLALFIYIAWSALTGQPRHESANPTVTVNPQGFPRTIIEDSGRKIIIPARPDRILPSDCGPSDILTALVDPKRIIALPQAVDGYGGAMEFYSAHTEKEIPRFLNFNAEQVISLKPDLFFFTAYRDQGAIPMIEARGIPVVKFENFRSFDGIRSSILTIGAATGEDEKAAALAAEFDRRLKKIEDAVAKLEHPRVLGYSNSGDAGFIVGTGESQDEILRRAGAINAAAELHLTGSPNFSFEQLLKADPDWLVVYGDEGQQSQQVKFLLKEPALAGMKAVKTHHIAVIPDKLYTALSQYVVDAVEILAKQLHPEAFAP